MADIEEAATLRSGSPLLDSGFDGLLDPQAGQAARKIGRGWEIIGPEACPLMLRRTLVSNRWFKVLWHKFLPGASDRAAHDHPRSFLTFVLQGGYDDIKPDGTIYCVYAPTIRYRSATHSHITEVGPHGATTLVLMGPLRRDWGFWHDGRWYPWRVFERKFGLGWRCP